MFARLDMFGIDLGRQKTDAFSSIQKPNHSTSTLDVHDTNAGSGQASLQPAQPVEEGASQHVFFSEADSRGMMKTRTSNERI